MYIELLAIILFLEKRKKSLKTKDFLIFKNFKNLKLEVITKSHNSLTLIATVLHLAFLVEFANATSLGVF
jgi:hypothetical protein